MTLMRFFCRLINGRCAQEPREPEREPHSRTQSTARSSAPYPPPRRHRAMKIGIIGAGQIGGTLTRRLTALGHQVFVANSRGPETLLDLASETGATAVSVPEAVRGMDLVIVTIPEKNILSLPAGLFANTPDQAGLPESKWVGEQLCRPVIKAFNNIYARHLLELGRPKGTPSRIALPVAGDDEAAKAIVLSLVEELGFDGVGRLIDTTLQGDLSGILQLRCGCAPGHLASIRIETHRHPPHIAPKIVVSLGRSTERRFE
jgi:predicted dinucleotide-binding enzyme